MLSFEPEIIRHRDVGLIPPDAAAKLIARERRDVVSVYTEVRILAWIAVSLIASGVGVLVSKNIEKIGPLTIAVAIAIASTSCYAWCWTRRSRHIASTFDSYVLLLAALLLSSDLGFIESQWHLLGSDWPRHFLVLAVVHAVTAYLFDSQAVLSLAIVAIGSWLGVERKLDTLLTSEHAMAEKAFTCAAIVSVWRAVNRRPEFNRVFDHFTANLLMWGGLILTLNDDTRLLGLILTIAFAAGAITFGFRLREEAFILYSFIYAVIAVDVTIVEALNDDVTTSVYILASSIATIVALFIVHAYFRKARA